MEYRRDVDGLRAIAILLVLFYHGGLSLFPSGFVGVDVFFVISGFLITSILYNALNEGRFSFLAFYNRRLWRLQPVFIAFMIGACLLTLIFYLPDDLLQFNRSARKATLFLSNGFFARTTTGYFSPDINQLPLLHTWSLSIEWQCYLLLPVLIYLLYRFVPPRYIKWFILGLTILSLIFAFYFTNTQADKAYYHLSSRIFEFLIGCCVAIGLVPRLAWHKYVIHILSIGLLAAIFWIATRQSIMHAYPNAYALSLCIATGVLIALNAQHPHNLAAQILRVHFLVFIGLLSYSLYIWHWLVFAVLRYQNIEETRFVLALAFILTFALAYLSWRFIEQPSRKLHRIKFSYSLLLLIVLPISLAHISDFAAKAHQGYPQRFNQELVHIYQQLERYHNPKRTTCISDKIQEVSEQCKIGSKNETAKRGLMIGDSFSNHYWGFMDAIGKAENITILAHGTSSCITLPDIYLYDWWHFHHRVYNACYQQTKRYYDMIQTNHYDYVIIGQVWRNYLNDNIINALGDVRSYQQSQARLQAALDHALQIIVDSGAKPILIKNTASMKENFHDCFYKHIKRRQPYDPHTCQFHLSLSAEEKWFDALFASMQQKYNQLIIIDPKSVQCPEGNCRADIHGVPVFRDVGHITDYASYQFGKMYLQTHPNPLIHG